MVHERCSTGLLATALSIAVKDAPESFEAAGAVAAALMMAVW